MLPIVGWDVDAEGSTADVARNEHSTATHMGYFLLPLCTAAGGVVTFPPRRCRPVTPLLLPCQFFFA